MKNETAQYNADLYKKFEQVDMTDIDDDIKGWINEDIKIHEYGFSEVNSEEEYQAIKEEIFEVMMER